jgi:hypothetical protein
LCASPSDAFLVFGFQGWVGFSGQSSKPIGSQKVDVAPASLLNDNDFDYFDRSV